MKSNVGIVIPYFGTLPKNMMSFIAGCRNNLSITWLIFTDADFRKFDKIAPNVIFFHMSFEEVKKRIATVVPYHFNLNMPYKICDYKPLYGSAFKDYLQTYKYWGYADLDTVIGNIEKYIQNGIDNNYDKIGRLGHFTLYKNNKVNNSRFKLPIIVDGRKQYIFRDTVSQTDKVCHFDEYKGIDKIYDQYDIPTYTNANLVNEILYENLDLLTNDKRFCKSKYSCYVWHNGKTIFFCKQNKNTDFESHEYGYFHFQKRQFTLFIDNPNVNSFSITTNGYSKLDSINKTVLDSESNENHSSFFQRFKYLIRWYMYSDNFTNKHIGKIYFPLKYVFWRVFHEKNFRI